jgi:hypothetical protein
MIQVAWVPGWYELDQAIEVGHNYEFAFWRVIPEDLRGPETLVLYNTLWRPEDAVVASGTIANINHRELGQIQKIDTRGLDYTFVLVDGTELLVNAEEQPGRLFERAGASWVAAKRVVSNWRCVVEFKSLSEPTPASTMTRRR